MTRQEVYREIQDTLGVIPTMFKALPDDALEAEWGLFKSAQLNEEVIPQKYRELIGLAAGAALGNRYCVAAHRELAKACGATDEEMEVAVRLAKVVAGWGVYVTGLDLDLEMVRDEIGQASRFIGSGRGAHGGTPTGTLAH